MITRDNTMILLINDSKLAEYTLPNVVVTTEWVANHLTDPEIRIVESNEDTLLYSSGQTQGL